MQNSHQIFVSKINPTIHVSQSSHLIRCFHLPTQKPKINLKLNLKLDLKLNLDFRLEFPNLEPCTPKLNPKQPTGYLRQSANRQK